MTTLRVLIIIFVLFSIWDPISIEAQQQEQKRPIVKVIYFLPNDRSAQANIDEKLVSQVKQAQKLFGDLMEAHGFERKTFQLEEDANGDVPVHHRSGSHNDADYRGNVFLLWNEFPETSDLSKDFYIVFFETDTQRDDLPPLCGLGFNATEYKGALLPSSGGCFEGVFGVNTIAHELAHAFELAHDNRSDADAQRIYLDSIDTMITSYCAAAWFDAHPAFNTGTTLLNNNTTANMLDPEPAWPPNNNIRLRFEISDPDGIHMVKLLSPTSDGDLKLRDCKVLNRVSNITVEFVTNELSPDTDTIHLRMRDVLRNYKQQQFILSDPLPFPPEEDLDVPDPNLAAAIQKQIGRITTYTILNLTELDARNKRITDLTGLQHAQNLTELVLFQNDISDVSLLSKLKRLRGLYLGYNPISDVSPLSVLTGLRILDIGFTGISDISSLKDLKNLEFLGIHGTGISEVPPLTAFKKLRTLYLHNNTISDITSLSALTQLNVLLLANNKISDVSPLSELVNLRELQLAGNPIQDFSPLRTLLANNPNLKIDIDIPFGFSTNFIADQTFVVGSDVSLTLPITVGGTAPYTYRLSPTPAGLQFDTTTRILSGKPTTASTTNMTYTATDATGQTASLTFTIRVIAPLTFNPSTVADQTFPADVLVTPLTLPIATGGTPPYTYTLAPLPAGLSFNATQRELSGKPTTAGTTTATYTATDAANVSASLTFTIEVTVGVILDVNGDGQVNVVDLAIVALFYGTQVPAGLSLPADVNTDGVVDILDLTAVAQGIDAAEGNLNGLSLEAVETALAAAAEQAADLEEVAEAPMGFNTRWDVLSSGTAYLNVTDAFADARHLPVSDVLSAFLALLAEIGAIPETTALLPNYPNPFNPETWIPYYLATDAAVVLTISDVRGGVVRTLALGHQVAGIYQSRARAAYWDGRNAVGEPVASGVYFYTLTAGEFTATRKLLIRK